MNHQIGIGRRPLLLAALWLVATTLACVLARGHIAYVGVACAIAQGLVLMFVNWRLGISWAGVSAVVGVLMAPIALTYTHLAWAFHLEAISVGVAFGAIGLALGVVQALCLRQHFSRAWVWVPTSTAAWAIAGFVADQLFLVVDPGVVFEYMSAEEAAIGDLLGASLAKAELGLLQGTLIATVTSAAVHYLWRCPPFQRSDS